MKRNWSLAAFLATAGVSSPAWTQTQSAGLEKIQSGFVLAPDFKLSEVDGDLATLVGGYGGWLSDRKLFLGAGAYWLANGAAGAELAYGGAVIEWFAQRSTKVNFSLRGLAGIGSGTAIVPFDDVREADSVRFGARGRGRFDRPFPTPSSVRVQEGFFVGEPQANFSYTFTDWFRVGVGAGYRLIGGAGGLESRFRGPTASVSLQFGSFY